MRRNDVLETVLNELEQRNIKPTVEHLSKHIRVTWDQGGVEKQQTVPSTGSDVRSRLNARAEVRRTLNGYQVTKPLLHRALAVPGPADDLRSHIARLEQRVEDLTDLLLEFMSPRKEETAKDKVLACLEFNEWTSAQDIARRSGISSLYVSNVLNTLKQDGLAMNGQRGQWRKRPTMEQRA